jgi:hypothetical protein
MQKKPSVKFTTLIQDSTGISRQSYKIRERNKWDSNREGRNQIIPIYR